MRELKRGQVLRIIEKTMNLIDAVTVRDTINLEEIYKIAEAVKGEKLTKREKLRISGIVRYNYPICREGEDKKIKILMI